jgi:hypothetical protein
LRSIKSSAVQKNLSEFLALCQRKKIPLRHLSPWPVNGLDYFILILQEAIACRAHGQFEQSLDILNWLEAQLPNQPVVIDNQIRALINLERCAEAMTCFNQLVELNGESNLLPELIAIFNLKQQELVASMSSHFHFWQRNFDFVPEIEHPSFLLILQFLTRSHQAFALGDDHLALVITQELSLRGWLVPDVLNEQMLFSWASLIIKLGSSVLYEYAQYDAARRSLMNLRDSADHLVACAAKWEILNLRCIEYLDLNRLQEMQSHLLVFLGDYPDHQKARDALTLTQPVTINMSLTDAMNEQWISQEKSYQSDLLIFNQMSS